LAAKQIGTDYITITANDGNTSVSQSFVLTVSGPTLTLTLSGQSLGIGFTAAPGASYMIQSASSLFGPWTTVTTVTADANGIVSYVATLNKSGKGLFYRALLQ
jgi:hypothetical protein